MLNTNRHTANPHALAPFQGEGLHLPKHIHKDITHACARFWESRGVQSARDPNWFPPTPHPLKTDKLPN